MANEQNLKTLTPKEAREQGRRGGKASGEARRRKKLLRECLTELLEREYESSEGKKMGGADLISVKLFKKAMDGDLKAFEIIRDTVGQKPVEKIEVDTIDPQARAEMDELLGL